MAKILSLTGIVTGLPVEAHHVSQSIKALTGADAYDISISGSLGVVGTTTLQTVSGSDFSGSFQGDGSRLTGITSSFITGSGVHGPYGANSILSSSYAVTSSFSEFATVASSSLVSNFTLTANSATSASYAVSSSHAQTASFVLGSVETASFVTGSNVFGPHGSNSILSASFAISSSIATSATSATSASFAVSSSHAEFADVSFSSTTASFALRVETASFIDSSNIKAAGSNGQVQFNNAGNFFGASQLIYSQSNGNFSIGTASFSDHTLEVAGQISQTGLGCSVALGRNALINTTSGTQNVAIGERAMFTTDSGLRNVAVGFQALEANAAAARNVAVGYQALNKTISPNNVAVGAQALFNSLCGQDNVGIGNCALYSNITGRCNIAIGSESNICNNNGVENVSIGFETLRNSTSGQRNVSIGHQSMNSTTTGVDNVALGWNSGFYAGASSTGNVFLGKCAGPSTIQTVSNKLYINNTQGSPLICGDFSLREINIDGALTASGLIYPSSDGSANQVLTTDGSGKLSFAAAGTVETASYVSGSNVDGPLGMGTINTASYAVTASYALNGGGGGGNTFTPYQTGSSADTILPKRGSNHCVIGTFSAISAGSCNSSSANCAIVAGGCGNKIGATQNNFGFIGGGRGNTLACYTGTGGVIVGGDANLLSLSAGGFIGGGVSNTIVQSERSVIVGGHCNKISAGTATYCISMVGGFQNTGSCGFTGILGGCKNYVTHDHSFIVGSNLTSDKSCYTFVNNLDVESTVSASVFSGSFVGDASGLTNLTLTGDITIFNNSIRYEAYNATQVVEILSSGTVFTGIDWSRSSTTITITSPSHGLTNGDNVVVRNMGDTDYVYGAISGVTTNTFQITNAVGSGAVSGATGAYIPAAGVTGASTSAVTILSPSSGNIQIQSIKVVTGTKTSSTFALTMPSSINNGAGANSSLLNMNPPIVAAHRLDTGGYNGNARITLNTASNFNVFNVNNLTNLRNNLIRFTF